MHLLLIICDFRARTCPQCNKSFSCSIRLFCSFNDDTLNEIEKLRQDLDANHNESVQRDEELNYAKETIAEYTETNKELLFSKYHLSAGLDELQDENQQLRTKLDDREHQLKINKSNGALIQADLIRAQNVNKTLVVAKRQLQQKVQVLQAENDQFRANQDDRKMEAMLIDKAETVRKTRENAATKASKVNVKTTGNGVKRRLEPVRSSSRIRAQNLKKDVQTLKSTK